MTPVTQPAIRTMTVSIPVTVVKAARKLLTRIRFERFNLPAIRHVLATIDRAGLTLAATDLGHWLETRVPAAIEPFAPGRFLIPAEALKAATQGDRGSSARFTCETTRDGASTLKLTTICGGMPVESVHHPEPEGPYPARPAMEGRITAVPKETFAALRTVAGCASTDMTRPVLNGVLFSPADGGLLVATDGRRLACAPARVTGRAFILPNPAAHVLAHPDFASRDAAIMQEETPDGGYVQFRSGPHTLIAKTIEGGYPDHRRVIPGNPTETATIPDSHKPAAIAWLRSLRGKTGPVVLSWECPGHMTLTRKHPDDTAATIRVPVTVEGSPPVIAFQPEFLADALEIGGVIALTDSRSPAVVRHPSGTFCVLMPMRCAVVAAENATPPGQATETPAQAA